MIFTELSDQELFEVDGGIAASAFFAIASGVCYACSGVAALCGNNSAAGWFTALGGVCDVIAGVCLLLQ